jgi:hypothetical protein
MSNLHAIFPKASKSFIANFGVGHAPKDHSNRRRSPKDYAVWEIHPGMALQVDQ